MILVMLNAFMRKGLSGGGVAIRGSLANCGSHNSQGLRKETQVSAKIIDEHIKYRVGNPTKTRPSARVAFF